jgi:C4-dicarboxylate transporter
MKSIDNADAGQAGAAAQRNSDATARARQNASAPYAILALVPILLTIISIPTFGAPTGGWGDLNSMFFQFASLLINPATTFLGMRMAARFVDRGPRRLAQLGGLLALIAIVPMFMWSYGTLWPLYLGCGITLAAAALIIASSIWVFAISKDSQAK